MKKFLSLAIALLLALGSMAAFSETTLTEYAVISEELSPSLIGNTDRVCLDGGNKDAMATLEGTPLTDYAYHTFFEREDYILATRVDQDLMLFNGLLSKDGSVLVPLEYNDVDVLNENWAVGIKLESADKSDYDYQSFGSNEVYKITTADIYYLPAGQMVATLPRINYLRSKAYDHYINVTDRATGTTTVYDATFSPLKQVEDCYDTSMLPEYVTFNDNGLQGLKTPDGAVILEPSYKIVYNDVKDGYFLVGDLEHYGLCDLSGRLVVPMTYDFIHLYSDNKYVVNGYVYVEQNNQYGYVNIQTGEVAMLNAEYGSPNNQGMSCFISVNDDTVIFSGDGVETRLTGVSSVTSFADGLFYRISKDSGYGLVDWHGEEILPAEYDSIDITNDNRYVVTKYTYRDPLKVYTLTSDLLPDEEQPVGESQLSDDAPVPETAETESADIADEAKAEAPAAEGSPVAELLSSAIALLKADPAANSAAAVSLINSVAAQISGNDNVIGQLNSVITLLNDNPATNGAAAVTLLESLIPLL